MAGTTQDVAQSAKGGEHTLAPLTTLTPMAREHALHGPYTRALSQCEVCADGTGAIALARRQWSDGTVDESLPVCGRHAQSDASGRALWTMIGLEFLA